MSTIDDIADTPASGTASNAKRLLVAGFLTLIAAGMGFAIRGGILGEWAQEFGFSMTELGTITGGGLIGFGLVILAGGMLIDLVGYKRLIVIAFILHFVSAAMTLAAGAVFAASGKEAVYDLLFWGMILFSVANGICEAVINPLTATLYPEKKTHYLNILHAGWPGGLVIGGLVALLAGKVQWEILMAAFLIPVVAYGLIAFREKFPQTEAKEAGMSWGALFKDCLVPFFFLLLIVHALVGYVELGTDSWIAKITGNILNSKMGGVMLFIYASMLMFILRFFAGPIVHRISSLGLLFVSGILGAAGLFLVSQSNSMGFMILAVTVYSLGKTFLWPTMLGVVGERFPKSSTIAMAMIGAVGMLSAGFLGGPGIGYKQDFYATRTLQESSEETYKRYKVETPKGFLFFPKISGLDGSKVGVALDQPEPATELNNRLEVLKKDEKTLDSDPELQKLSEWWDSNKGNLDVDKEPLANAGLFGSRMALKLTAIVPAVMAVIYLLMILGIKAKGGGKGEKLIHAGEIPDEKLTGGVEGPMEG